jgi:hypothetical protein
MATWQCVKNCGACCQLDPSERPELSTYLTPAELELYLSLVGPDGWCLHYDHQRRECTIYDDRPRFCRVSVETFDAMYGIAAEALDDFAIDCCQQHIEDLYGGDSPEMVRFNRAVGLAEA